MIMIKSIKTKLFLLFLIFMASFVLCGVLLNALFLEHYYIYRNRGIFLQTGIQINDVYMNNRDSIIEVLRSTDREEGINIAIADNNLEIHYSSLPQKGDYHRERLPLEIEKLIKENTQTLEKSYVYSIVERPGRREREIVFLSLLDGKEFLVLKKSMKGISESVSIAHQFYLFAGLLIILLGGIVVFIFSGKITRPIIQMSTVAEGISNLDFERRVMVDSEDELGHLAGSINKMSEKLSASLNALKQDVEHRKELVRNMSHELKTPIGVIKGYAEGLKYGVVEDKEKTQKYCTVISDECDRMDGMVRELLSLSMLESGMSPLKISQVPVGEVIHTVADKFEPLFIEKSITLEVNCKEDLYLSADRELLERVVNNYITNAIHHAEGAKQIRVDAEKKDHGVRISVFNTGNHIQDENLENIWEVFYKVDRARSRHYGGHGLGLSIVRLIAELHGGTTGVENVKEGVLFFMELPSTS
jgi:two-component system, OmpR family, sensor histidine kinase VanS